MSKEDWIWYGVAGHFNWEAICRFRLKTYVNGYIVSTVGEYIPDQEVLRITHWRDTDLCKLHGDSFSKEYLRKYGCEEIGFGRKYETMVFKAKKCDCGCAMYVQDSGDNLDFEGYNIMKEAHAGHYKMCEKWDKNHK